MFRRRYPTECFDHNTTWRSEPWWCLTCGLAIKRNKEHDCPKRPVTPTEKEPTVDEEEWPTEKKTMADFDLATPTTKQIKDNQTYLLHSFLTSFSSITSVKDFNDHWWNRAGTSILFKGTSPAGEHRTLVLGKLLEEYGPLVLCDTLRRPKFVIKDTDDGAKITIPTPDTSPPAIVTANEEETAVAEEMSDEDLVTPTRQGEVYYAPVKWNGVWVPDLFPRDSSKVAVFLREFAITRATDALDRVWTRYGSVAFKLMDPAQDYVLDINGLRNSWGSLFLFRNGEQRPVTVAKSDRWAGMIDLPVTAIPLEKLYPGAMAGTPTVEDTPTGTPAPKMGWVCPVCSRGLAPWMDHCKCKSPKTLQTPTRQVTFQGPLTTNDQYRQTTSGTWLPLGMR